MDIKQWEEALVKMKQNKECENRVCNNINFDSCMNKAVLHELSGSEYLQVIGRGAYGIVFPMEYNVNGSIVDCAVKCQFKRYKKDEPEPNYHEEIEYSYICAVLDIGPQVYDFFIYMGEESKIPPTILNKILQEFTPYSSRNYQLDATMNVIVQFIIMKAYDRNCSEALNSENFKPATKSKIISHICKLLDKKISYGLYCHDIKLSNFVMSVVPSENVDVKMIDFGQDFCTRYDHNKYPQINGDLYNNTPNFTCVDMFRVSLLVRLFIECRHLEPELIFNGFLNTSLHTFLNMANWEDNIEKYTNDAIDAEKRRDYRYDPEIQYKHRVATSVSGEERELVPDKMKKQYTQVVVSQLNKMRNYFNTLEPNVTPQHISLQPPTSFRELFNKNLPYLTGMLDRSPLRVSKNTLIAQPVAQSITQPAPQPAAQPIAQPITQPIAQPNPNKLSNMVVGVGILSLAGLASYAVYRAIKSVSKHKSRHNEYKLYSTTKKTRNRSNRTRR